MITSISQRIIDAITAKGVNVKQSFAGHEIEVEMTWYSPAGQDVYQTITVNTDTVSSQCDVDQSFAQQLEDLYEDYDPSAEAYLWISDGRDGKTAEHAEPDSANIEDQIGALMLIWAHDMDGKQIAVVNW